MSVKNVTAAIYRVHNLSDDKPKFLLRKIAGPTIEEDIADNAITITAEQCNATGTTTQYALRATSKQRLDTTISCLVGYRMDALSCTSSNPMSTGTFMATFSKSSTAYNVKFGLKNSKFKSTKLPVDIIDVQADTAREVKTKNGYVRFTQ